MWPGRAPTLLSDLQLLQHTMKEPDPPPLKSSSSPLETKTDPRQRLWTVPLQIYSTLRRTLCAEADMAVYLPRIYGVC